MTPPRFATLRRWFWRLFAGLLLAGVGALFLAPQREAALPAAPPGSNERLAVQARLLWQQVRPGAAPAGVARQVRLHERDLNALLEQASQSQGDAWRARLQVPAEGLKLQLSTHRFGFWWNLNLEWDLSAGPDGQAPTWPPLTRATLGRLPLPPSWVTWAAWQAAGRAPWTPWRDAALNLWPLLDGWQATPGWLSVRWRWQPETVAKALASLITPAQRQALVAQHEQLRILVDAGRPSGAVEVQALFPTLAQLALYRHQQGGEAATELRAVLVVMTLQALRRDLGLWLPEARRPAAAPGQLPDPFVVLAGRDDMAEHFLLSALLAWQGGERATHAIGLAKELADRRVGSGFSFNDLAADEAGLRFGLLARQQPLALLQKLAHGMGEGEYFPAIADLPEFLSDPEFRSRYERVGSPAFEAEMLRIRERVAALPLYAGFP